MIIPPPIPGPISFHALFQDTGGHTRDLAEANAARARVRTALKATRKQGVEEGGDWSAANKATGEYLIYLYAILACVESDDLLHRSDPALSSQPLKKTNQRASLPSLHFELVATLLAHGLCMANQAATLVASLGSYEISSSVSSSALKVHDETVNQAADTLCRASGVLAYLAETAVPRWEAAVGQGGKSRPVEFGRDVVSALSKMFLADANLLAIRRLLSRSLFVAHSTTTPGPPLSSTHPSPSLLAKLHLNVYALYDEARSLVKAASRANDAAGEVSPQLRRYLSDGRALSQALSYKWLGVDCGENHSLDQTGDALGWLAIAKVTLEEIEGKAKGLKGLRIGKGKAAGKSRKTKVQEELDSVAAFTSAYKKVNDTVHFQRISPATNLLARVPAGRAALTIKTFSPPAPAFKPRASGALQGIPPPLGAEDGYSMSALDINGDSSDDDAEGDYFGAGQYF